MRSPVRRFDMRGFLAVALLAVLAIAGAIWIAFAAIAASTVEEHIEMQREQLAALDVRARGLVESGAAGAAGTPEASLYFAGATPAIAAASLQRTVDELVEDAGGRVVESQILPVDEEEERAHRLDLRASFESDIDALQAALYGIETHLPLMIVRSLQVRSLARPGNGKADEENPRLQVTLVASGFWTEPTP